MKRFTTALFASVAGTLSGLRGEPRIVMIDDHKLDVPPARHMLRWAEARGWEVEVTDALLVTKSIALSLTIN